MSTEEKPDAEVIGQDGNVFMTMGISAKALKRAGKPDKAEEMAKRVQEEAKSYGEALNIMQEYVNFV